MKIYIVNAKYFYTDLDVAFEKAKAILRERGGTSESYTITSGKNQGYCVHLNDDWEKVGNRNLLSVMIRIVKTENNT